MAKIFRDIKKSERKKPINLRGEKKPAQSIKPRHFLLFKREAGPTQIVDITPKKPQKYLYVKGEKSSPPKYLGNILKLATLGLLIIFLINIAAIYGKAKRIEQDVKDQAFEGYSHLIDAGKSATKTQFKQAFEIFNKALISFSGAEDSLWFISTDKTFYAHNESATYAINALLESGKHFAVAGGYFIEAMESFNNIPIYFVSKNQEGSEAPSITDTLKEGLAQTDLAIAEISEAAKKLSKINEESLPVEIRERVIFAKTNIEDISEILNSISKHFPAILKLLGDRYPHRYLILLQNNSELRPTGGFIGSYAIVDVNEGYIANLEVHDVYDIDGSFGEFVEPPQELKMLTNNWRFRDSNYSPDFSVSAAKAKWFLEKEGGPTVETVIGMNQGLLKTLLGITGPIQVGDFGKLTAENYELLLSFIIEGKIWGAEDPKHILKVFIPAFKEEIMQEKYIAKVLSKIYLAIQQKHLMFYSSDPEIQELFDQSALSGRIHPPGKKEDYLSVINISIGGTKSDKFTEEKITHQTHIDKYGGLTDELTIKHSHLWTDDIYYEWKRILASYGITTMPDQIVDILGRGRNKNLLKIYVPEGSVLLENSGGDVEMIYDKDLKMPFFFAVMEINAGESAELKIKYKLPYTLDLDPAGTYKLRVEKQPGSPGSIFTKLVTLDPELYTYAAYPQDATVKEDGQIIYAKNLVYDRDFSSVHGR
ncbi:DUF4012 domain-containing protein [Patescibacteria group bacterium]|nr:DUF4012 domain-containing protein [Patescibacteria group bacterium]